MSKQSLALFGAATRTWFEQSFDMPTPVQSRGWLAIASGNHVLLSAPTGSGKTLAAFLFAIDSILTPAADIRPGVQVLYISPLKALAYDIERNLREPLTGILRTAERLDLALQPARIAVRTGDTTQAERREQLKRPSQILVTTPESLYLLLSSRASETLASVRTVIVDEIHALAPTKRGAHLALCLERLSALAEREPQRIGLSATVRPMALVGHFLGGDREVELIDASTRPKLDLAVTVPVPDMDRLEGESPARRQGGAILAEPYAQDKAPPATERGIWPAIYPQLVAEVRAHSATIIFVNSRGLCERLTQRLNEIAGEELVLAHHGSVSYETRAKIEDGLKAGRLRGIVATSSLELGVDMGAVDRVVLVESPGSVARGLQRVGRAGHQVDSQSSGRIYPKFKGDLLECAVLAERMRNGEIESIAVPSNPLDVLCQHIVSMCVMRNWTVPELQRVLLRAYPYAELSPSLLRAVLDMLSGVYPSTDFADLRPRISWDRSDDTLSARRGSAMIVRMNAGTIPDRGLYSVHLGKGGPKLGELDEEMVFETRLGENILLGASTWRVEQITRDRVLVSPAPGEPGRLPFWRGDGPGRPLELGRAIGRFVEHLSSMKNAEMVRWLGLNTVLDELAVQNLAAYICEQKAFCGVLPSDRTLVVECFRDELGDWRVCLLSPFGARIHAPWAMAIQRRLSALSAFEVQVMYTDDGIVLRFADMEALPPLEHLLPDLEDLDETLTGEVAHTAMFAGLFRENASRALLLPRRSVNSRNPLWAQRIRAQQLLATAQQYPSFPIVLETYRQALKDVFDVDGLRQVLRDIRSGAISLLQVETPSASPFARSLVFAYVAAYLYEGDAPLAERKAQALTLDRGLLNELLGQAELRELISVEALAELEASLSCRGEDRRAADEDQLHDLLRRLGDLSEVELALRSTMALEPALAALCAARRAARINIAGEPRWIAAQDAGLYRDALGVMPPAGLPEAFLRTVDEPLCALFGRFARQNGPFLIKEVAHRYGLRTAQVDPALRLLESRGALVHGELRPGGVETDWCDVRVLRRLKRMTLARLRNEVAAVDAQALAQFLPHWHGLVKPRRGHDALLEAIAQLQGLPMSWQALTQDLLPARVTDFKLQQLDMLCATGAVVWVGHSALGPRDGRVVLYLREHFQRLVMAPAQSIELLHGAATAVQPDTPAEDERDTASRSEAAIARTIVQALRARGACFLTDLQSAVEQVYPGGSSAAFEPALWSLVWAGLISNDTTAPLQQLSRRRSSNRSARWRTVVAGGRWSLVGAGPGHSTSVTEQSLARAQMLLDRYGIVSREAAMSEGLPGGFSAVYPVLKRMEEAGRVRRGHFVEGLTGAQFAPPGAIDRLRAARKDDDAPCTHEDVQVLAAIDPANPYGSLLPWPRTTAMPGTASGASNPRRVVNAWLVLVRGLPAFYLNARGTALTSFVDTFARYPQACEFAAAALTHLPRRRRALTIERIDSEPIRQSPFCDALLKAGFLSDYKGLSAPVL